MSKARIRSSKSTVYVVNPVDNKEIKVGETDSLTEKSLDELVTNQPMGEETITSQTVFGGYELNFEGGKVDAELAALFHAQDELIAVGERSPYFKVKQVKKYYGGKPDECFWYHDVTLHGYEVSTPNKDALTERFNGFSGAQRTVGEGSAIQQISKKSLVDKIVSQMKDNGKI